MTHKNPCPMFTIGWTGEAAAASFTMDLQFHIRIRSHGILAESHTRHPVAGRPLSVRA